MSRMIDKESEAIPGHQQIAKRRCNGDANEIDNEKLLGKGPS